LGRIVAYFKYQSTKGINKSRCCIGTRVWQRNYYEHIIRNEEELRDIREYIMSNPLKWALDKDNPENWNNKE
jgi:REP element-mobilizing transposase RayT